MWHPAAVALFHTNAVKCQMFSLFQISDMIFRMMIYTPTCLVNEYDKHMSSNFTLWMNFFFLQCIWPRPLLVCIVNGSSFSSAQIIVLVGETCVDHCLFKLFIFISSKGQFKGGKSRRNFFVQKSPNSLFSENTYGPPSASDGARFLWCALA